ncbi:hypothetical protein IFO70_25685 [Phormidium tenue FACHB-886]|nr:hypothetical protein [Phormidium tenue FACHB-886]
MNTVSGSTGNDFIAGSGDAELIDGYAGDDTIFPGAGDDQIVGGEGADEIKYSPGNDLMQGNSGNDRYFVNDAGDVVVELPNEGDLDQITTTVNNYVLPLNVEVLYLEGDAKTATGNLQNNRIIGLGAAGTTLFGDAGDDFISGGLGACRLYGNEGNDVLTAQTDLLGDLLSGGSGNDELIGTQANDQLVGGSDDDLIYGFSISTASDILTGIDTATGGGGADIFDLGGKPTVPISSAAVSTSPIGYLGAGHMLITDFSRAQGDKIWADLSATYSLSESNGNTVIAIGTDLVAVVQGVTGLSIAEDFIGSPSL